MKIKSDNILPLRQHIVMFSFYDNFHYLEKLILNKNNMHTKLVSMWSSLNNLMFLPKKATQLSFYLVDALYKFVPNELYFTSIRFKFVVSYPFRPARHKLDITSLYVNFEKLLS